MNTYRYQIRFREYTQPGGSRIRLVLLEGGEGTYDNRAMRYLDDHPEPQQALWISTKRQARHAYRDWDRFERSIGSKRADTH